MMNRQDSNIIIMYAATLIVVGIVLFVLMNANSWFLSEKNSTSSVFTPAARNTISKEEIRDSILQESKFKSLGPLLTAEEIKALQSTPGEDGTEGGGTPSPTVRRDVRKDNPFIPF